MQTIIIKLDSQKLVNPDLDMRYTIPDYIEAYTDGVVTDNGYDYVNEDGNELAIWLDTQDAAAQVQNVIHCLKTKRFCGNDLSQTAQIYISEQDCAKIDQCTEVSFVPNSSKELHLPDYLKVAAEENCTNVAVCFDVEAPKPYTLGQKLNTLNEQAYMNGYNWEALLICCLEKNLPDLLEGLESDPEAGSYVALYENTPDNIERANRLADFIAYLVEDEEDLCQLVREDGETIEIEWD
jgi:hypothetical protein